MKLIVFFIGIVVAALIMLGVAGKQFGMNIPGMPDLQQLPMPNMPVAKVPQMPEGVGEALGVSETSAVAEKSTVYKWQDASGTWHYGDEPPEGATAEPLTVYSNQNMIQAFKSDEPEEQPAAAKSPTATPGQGPAEQVLPTLPNGMPASYQELGKLLGVQMPEPRQQPD